MSSAVNKANVVEYPVVDIARGAAAARKRVIVSSGSCSTEIVFGGARHETKHCLPSLISFPYAVRIKLRPNADRYAPHDETHRHIHKNRQTHESRRAGPGRGTSHS